MLPELESCSRPRTPRGVLYLVECGGEAEALDLLDGRGFHLEVTGL